MSWTQAFFVLSDEHLWAFDKCVSAEEKERIRAFFTGQRVDGQVLARDLICLTLSPQLWRKGGLELAASVSAVTEQAPILPELEPFDPEQFLSRIREAMLSLAAGDTNTVLRIYLDPAWQAIAGRLVDAGCEVVLMDHPSEGPNPAGLWRYLALEDGGRAVTFMGLESLPLIGGYLERTQALRESGLKVWRLPMDRRRNYRPIKPDGFGSLQSYPSRDLLCAYAWFICHPQEKLPMPDGTGHLGLQASVASERQASWERPDLNEFFLLSALYPRVAFDGMLTLVEPDDQHSRWLILDTEYATWANPANETIFVAPLAPPESADESTKNFRSSALVEMLFHLNRYPQFQDLWLKPETAEHCPPF